MNYPCEMKIKLCTNEWFRVYAIPSMGVQSFLRFFLVGSVLLIFLVFLFFVLPYYVSLNSELSKLRFPHTNNVLFVQFFFVGVLIFTLFVFVCV